MANTWDTRRELLAREGLASLVILAGLILAAALYPLEPVGSAPTTIPGPEAPPTAPAPWLFLGLQELLRWLPQVLAGLALPGLALAWLGALPWLSGGGGPEVPSWSRRPAWPELAAWALLLAWAGLTLVGAWRHL